MSEIVMTPVLLDPASFMPRKGLRSYSKELLHEGAKLYGRLAIRSALAALAESQVGRQGKKFRSIDAPWCA